MFESEEGTIRVCHRPIVSESSLRVECTGTELTQSFPVENRLGLFRFVWWGNVKIHWVYRDSPSIGCLSKYRCARIPKGC